MGCGGRVSTSVLMIGGAMVIALMVYALSLGPSVVPAGTGSGAEEEVSVFLPDLEDWQDFRDGLDLAIRRGLAVPLTSGRDWVMVRTRDQGRSVRLVWHDSAGVEEMRDEVGRLLSRDRPPEAFVGSSNTVLTAALADALRREVGLRGDGVPAPVLLVPWATSVQVRQVGSSTLMPLLGIYPGRTFRFCPNNRTLAGRVVGCVSGRVGGRRPDRVFLVLDRDDPYSRDLADGFREALAEAAPEAEVRVREVGLSEASGGATEVPGVAEHSTVQAIVSGLREGMADGGPDRHTWIILPLQGKPIRRMLLALQGESLLVDEALRGGLDVLCGDGIGAETLRELAPELSVPIWCASSGLAPTGYSSRRSSIPAELSAGVLLSFEICTALLKIMDRSAEERSGVDLREALLHFRLAPSDAEALGRSIAFDASGERNGEDLGIVLELRPPSRRIHAFGLERGGRWSGPWPLELEGPSDSSWRMDLDESRRGMAEQERIAVMQVEWDRTGDVLRRERCSRSWPD